MKTIIYTSKGQLYLKKQLLLIKKFFIFFWPGTIFINQLLCTKLKDVEKTAIS